MKNDILLTAQNVYKTYKEGLKETRVLKNINLEIREGEFLVITGKSGSGKSTLLYVLSLLDRPTEGKIIFKKCDTFSFSEKNDAQCRLNNFGFVFQNYALLPELSALENVMLPVMERRKNWKGIKEEAINLLTQIGLGNQLNNRPPQLSGGENQRVSIARAVINNPKIIFADEPTANLDSKRSEEIMELISDMNKKGITIVLATHEKSQLIRADRVINIEDGEINQETSK